MSAAVGRRHDGGRTGTETAPRRIGFEWITCTEWIRKNIPGFNRLTLSHLSPNSCLGISHQAVSPACLRSPRPPGLFPRGPRPSRPPRPADPPPAGKAVPSVSKAGALPRGLASADCSRSSTFPWASFYDRHKTHRSQAQPPCWSPFEPAVVPPRGPGPGHAPLHGTRVPSPLPVQAPPLQTLGVPTTTHPFPDTRRGPRSLPCFDCPCERVWAPPRTDSSLHPLTPPALRGPPPASLPPVSALRLTSARTPVPLLPGTHRLPQHLAGSAFSSARPPGLLRFLLSRVCEDDWAPCQAPGVLG